MVRKSIEIKNTKNWKRFQAACVEKEIRMSEKIEELIENYLKTK